MNSNQLLKRIERLEKEKVEMFKDERKLLDELDQKEKVIEVLLKNIEQERLIEILGEYFDFKSSDIVKKMITRMNLQKVKKEVKTKNG